MMTMIDMEATGVAIKNKLKENGIPAKELAKELGFASPNAVYKWMKGETLPTLDNLVLVALFLDTTMDKLIKLKTV